MTSTTEQLECLDGHGGGCEGEVEYRMPLSGTGRSYPRCDFHWAERWEYQQQLNERYPVHAPADFDFLDAGEHWDEDY